MSENGWAWAAAARRLVPMWRMAPTLVLLACGLAGCAGPAGPAGWGGSGGPPSAATAPAPRAPLADADFQPHQAVPAVEQVLAVDDAMRDYIARQLPATDRQATRQRRLLEALYARSGLQLEYDARYTRNAAQAFADRRGNCLSLVLMTAAFARELGMVVRFNEVDATDPWTLQGDLALRSHHVNLTLTDLREPLQQGQMLALTVDFVPGLDLRQVRMRRIELPRVMAMYYNNRAAETLAEGRVAEAYWLARAAVLQDPGFAPGRNTLGVVYHRAGRLDLAAAVFEQLLARQDEDPGALANLALVRRDQGRLAEAAALRARLAAVEPTALAGDMPRALAGELLLRAQAALARGDLAQARQWLEADGQRHGPTHQQQFWLAQVLFRQGLAEEAEAALERARLASPPEQQPRYAGKLAWLRAQGQATAPPATRVQ